jgi:hypothetical protein
MSVSQAQLNWKFNACKKIAELTKVIFRLQTESLGRKDFVAHVKKKCDQEIEAIVQRSSEATQEVQRDVSEYRDRLQQIPREECQAKFENQSREYEILKTRLNSETKHVVNCAMLQISALKKAIELFDSEPKMRNKYLKTQCTIWRKRFKKSSILWCRNISGNSSTAFKWATKSAMLRLFEQLIQVHCAIGLMHSRVQQRVEHRWTNSEETGRLYKPPFELLLERIDHCRWSTAAIVAKHPSRIDSDDPWRMASNGTAHDPAFD